MGQKITDAEVQQVYDEFWKRIVEPNGELDIEQVKKELFDFRIMMQEVPKVYEAVTGGKFAKPLTEAQAVIDAAEAHYRDWYAEDEPDGPTLDITHPDWRLGERWIELGYSEELMRKLQPGQPCGPGCAQHVTQPCYRCGRYQAGLAGPVSYPVLSIPWETHEGWEKEVAQSVVFSNMAPREAKEILELVGVSLGQPGYTVKLILKAIKATPHLLDLIRVVELVEVAGDTDIVCPFCAVVGDREHLSDCLVTRSRMVLARVKAAMA